MSQEEQREGYWLASDGNWYPPQGSASPASHPNEAAFAGSPAFLAGWHRRQLDWPTWGRVGWWLFLLPVAIGSWAATLEKPAARYGGFALAGALLVSGAIGDGGGDAAVEQGGSILAATEPPTTTDAPTTTAAPTTTSAPTTIAPVPTTLNDEQAVEAGYVALCNDGGFSDNTDFGATCSGGDGIDHWLATYGECNNGRTILMSAEADCDGFKGLKPPDYEPSALPEDVALCANGLFSDYTDFAKTCSTNGGVETWLSGYVQCNDGAIGALHGGQSCGGRGGFKRLMPWDYTPPTTAPPTLGESLASIVAENVTGDVLGVTAESPTVVVTIRSSESFTEGLTKDSARFAVADALEAVQGADLPPDITEVVVVIRFELVNQYGEVSEESVIVARFTRGTLDRIVFDSIDPRQILLLAEGDLSVHPAFRKGDGS